MGKISKEFWVSDDFIESIKDGEVSQVFIVGSNIAFSTSPKKEYIHNNKITISYEIDREVTIKESDLRKMFNDLEFSGRDYALIKQRIFGGGENE